MTRRALTALIATILVALAVTSIAAGQPAERDATWPELALEAAPADTQALSNRICRWLTARRFQVGDCPQVYVSDDLPRMVAREECPDNPVVRQCRAAQSVAAIATRSGTVMAPDWADLTFGIQTPSADAILTHTHELLHRVQAARAAGVMANGRERIALWDWTPDDHYWEEALAEAVAQDLLPGIHRSLYPRFEVPRRPPYVAYGPSVRHLRALTARATRSPWRSRRARSMRAWLLRSDITTRRAAIAALTERSNTR